MKALLVAAALLAPSIALGADQSPTWVQTPPSRPMQPPAQTAPPQVTLTAAEAQAIGAALANNLRQSETYQALQMLQAKMPQQPPAGK